MKKLFVAVALVMGLGTSAVFASNLTDTRTESTIVADEYAVIELKDVPQAVQDAVAKNYAGNSIKEAHAKTAEDGTKNYKLILVNSENAETIAVFKENGEEVKEEATQQ